MVSSRCRVCADSNCAGPLSPRKPSQTSLNSFGAERRSTASGSARREAAPTVVASTNDVRQVASTVRRLPGSGRPVKAAWVLSNTTMTTTAAIDSPIE